DPPTARPTTTVGGRRPGRAAAASPSRPGNGGRGPLAPGPRGASPWLRSVIFLSRRAITWVTLRDHDGTACGGSLARPRPPHNHGWVEPELICLAHPRRGHFELGTGYHGDLWLDLDALFLRPAVLRPHGQRLGDLLAEHGIDAVCGPMTAGAFLALAMADLLGAALLPAYSHPGQAGGPAGYRLPGSTRDMFGGWRVAIVDDAVN